MDSPSKYDGEDCRHYIAPKGMNSLTKYFLSGTNTFFGTKVVSIKVLENKKVGCGITEQNFRKPLYTFKMKYIEVSPFYS